MGYRKVSYLEQIWYIIKYYWQMRRVHPKKGAHLLKPINNYGPETAAKSYY